MKMKWIQLLLLAACLVFGTVACGSDDPDNTGGGGISGGNNSGNNNAATDAGDADASDPGDGSGEDVDDGGNNGGPDGSLDVGSDGEEQCPAMPCAAGEFCDDGICVVLTPQIKCADAEDLGSLTTATPIIISDTTADATDVMETECAESPGVEHVYRFTVAEDSRVTFDSRWPAQFDAKVEFRRDNCADPTSGSVSCFDADNAISMSAGETVYLVIEQDVGRGNDFELELSAIAEDCPAGQITCSNEVLEVCTGANTSNNYECASGCDSATACAGTACDNAIAVSASATFAGELQAYENLVDFADNDLCAYQGSTVNTPGPEVYFKLEGISSGQTVTFNTGGNLGIFLAPSCNATPIACQDVLLSAGTTSSVDWQVPSGINNEDIYVIIDKRTQTSGPFDYEIQITGP